MFPTLTITDPLTKDKGKKGPVHDAQWLMQGHGRFGETYYHGKVDGVYGPSSALAAYEAKFWCGYPAKKLDKAFGPVLYSYLLPLDQAEAVRLPRMNQLRRLWRVQNAKRRRLEYRNPYRAVVGLRFAGVDQGVDYGGGGDVYAIGPGRVTYVSTTSGWPGGAAVGYTLSAGAKAGQSVYFAENITPSVRVGQLVDSGTVICVMHDAYPYTESGWAHPGTVDPLAPLFPDPHSPKPEGEDFCRLLKSLGTPVA